MADLYLIAVPTPFLVGPVNVYLLDGPEPTLIDVGPNTGGTMAALWAGLAARSYALAGIGYLIIAHAHLGHYGLAALIEAGSGARMCRHRYGRTHLASDQAKTGR